MIPRDQWYPRLVRWKNWEIPRPGKEAIVGALIVAGVSLTLHMIVLFICRTFRTG